MPDPRGTPIGPYEVLGPLGAGGMGEVFRARDARLGRDVAIKALPPAFAQDPERLARFEREARLLASLSHPNIAAIHGLEESGGHRYLVLEFVDGETLQARLRRGPLPVDEALDVCRQIAAGIEAAHESGVVHRDLKPGNVMITPAGAIKVLDFGLAKGGGGNALSDPGLSASPTATYMPTAAGVILGTAAYMSPEQARGRAVDRRTDIWSFGCVLYECLTGRRCFEGETLSDTIALILQREVDWSALPRGTPARVRELLARCLERDASRRLRDAGEARIALEQAIAAGADPEPAAAARVPRRAGILLGLMTAFAGVALTLAVTRLTTGPGSSVRPGTRVAIPLPVGRELEIQPFLAATLWDVSDDGQVVAARFATMPGSLEPRVFVRRTDEADWKPVAGSERAVDFPVLSADHRAVTFLSEVSSESRELRLMKVDLARGAAPTVVCDVPDDSYGIVAIDADRVLMTHVSGTRFAVRTADAAGPPRWRAIEAGDYRGTVDLVFRRPATGLPHDQAFVGTTLYRADGWHRGTAVLDLRTGRLTPVLEDGHWPELLPGGVLLFARGTTVMAVRYDVGARRTRGPAVPLETGVRSRGEWMPGRFRVTTGGDLVYSAGGAVGDRRTLEWLAPGGAWSAFSSAPRSFTNDPTATGDGSRIAVAATNPRGLDEIWTFQSGDRVGQRSHRSDAADLSRPVVSRDGRRLAYARQGVESGFSLEVAPFEGGTPRTVLTSASLDTVFTAQDWHPDGRRLLVRSNGAIGTGDLLLVDVDAPGDGPVTPRVLLAGQAARRARFSPDGRRLALESSRSGRPQVFVCDVGPDGGLSAPRLLMPSGTDPVWSADGRRVLYVDTTLVREVTLSPSGGALPGSVRTLYDGGDRATRLRGGVTLPDGRSLCVVEASNEGLDSRLELVQGWAASVRGRLPR